MTLKIIIDILMFICLILEFSRGYFPPIYHEILGIILLILVVLHLIVNKAYLKFFLKGKYGIKRSIMAGINIGFFICLFLCLIFGILSSQDLLPTLNIHSMSLISLHKIFGFISIILLGLHLGINITPLTYKISKKIKYNVINWILGFLIIGYGIYVCAKIDFIDHLTGRYGFSMMDDSVFINIVRYLGIILMFVIITNSIYKKIK